MSVHAELTVNLLCLCYVCINGNLKLEIWGKLIIVFLFVYLSNIIASLGLCLYAPKYKVVKRHFFFLMEGGNLSKKKKTF